jgi:hypothetical protein
LRNVNGFLSATGKWRILLRNKGTGELNLEFGANGQHFEYYDFK